MKVNTAADAPDAHLSFSKDLAFSLPGRRHPGGQHDFITVAEHEIGHALDFTSGVDSIDYCLDHASGCGLSGAINQFEDGEWFTTLDLFRYSAPGKLDLRVGGSPYFSINGVPAPSRGFSTGRAWQWLSGQPLRHLAPDPDAPHHQRRRPMTRRRPICWP